MALKGIDIFKLSPKTNCKECGYPTCMGFCMKVAQGAEQIEKCPHFAPEAVEQLNRQSQPPMQTVTVGGHKLGGETVLFRHEKALVNKNLFAVSVCTCMDEETVDARLKEAAGVDYIRISERMYVEFICVINAQESPEAYAALVKKAAALGRPLILDCEDVSCARAALEVCGKDVILDGANAENWEQMHQLATEAGVALGVKAEDISGFYDLTRALEEKGNRNLVLDAVLRWLDVYSRQLEQSGFEPVKKRWQELSCMSGKAIQIVRQGEALF